jgi:hypothetical protein
LALTVAGAALHWRGPVQVAAASLAAADAELRSRNQFHATGLTGCSAARAAPSQAVAAQLDGLARPHRERAADVVERLERPRRPE